jgi:hypothetical protein
MNSHQEAQGEFDTVQRKSIWKMNSKMKNEKEKRQQNLNLIEAELWPKIKEIVVFNDVEMNQIHINKAVEQVDKFDKIFIDQ